MALGQSRDRGGGMPWPETRAARQENTAADAGEPTDAGAEPDAGELDAGGSPDAGSLDPFRFAVVTQTCGPADGFAWRGVVSRTALSCDDVLGVEGEAITLYLFGGGPSTLYTWDGEGFDPTVAHCPGGGAPCVESTEGEAQVQRPREAPPMLRLRAVFPSFTIDDTLPLMICENPDPVICG